MSKPLINQWNRKLVQLCYISLQMYTEKMIALSVDMFDTFMSKWENFTEIDDFLGPGCQIIV